MQASRFRRDLYFRLNVFPVSIPPLRARQGDIPLLARYLVDRFAVQLGRRINGIPGEVMQYLQRYSWPGNVRELENVLERAVIISHNGALHLDGPDDLEEPHAGAGNREVLIPGPVGVEWRPS